MTHRLKSAYVFLGLFVGMPSYERSPAKIISTYVGESCSRVDSTWSCPPQVLKGSSPGLASRLPFITVNCETNNNKYNKM
jgi:hypothetical protein